MAVVVGFIPTEVGFSALAAAREEAELRGGPLIVVNVIRDGVSQEHTEDDIAEVLLRVVEDEKAELLVLGIRRHRDLARHLLGLTVQKLLLSARSEVLVV